MNTIKVRVPEVGVVECKVTTAGEDTTGVDITVAVTILVGITVLFDVTVLFIDIV